MQTKFTEIANKLTTIKSGLAEAISAKGVETAPNAPFSTMISNIGNITSGGGSEEPLPTPEIKEWVKPHDWPDIESEPLEAGEIRVLMGDYLGKEGNVVQVYKATGATSIKATVDWGDGTIEEIDSTSTSTYITHDYVDGGTPCDRGYNTYVVKIKFKEPDQSPSRLILYRSGATSSMSRHTNLLWVYGDMQYLSELSNFTCHPSLYGYSIMLERGNLINTSHVEKMSYLFYNCNMLQSVPQLDTSSVTMMASMFSGCNMIQVIPDLNTSKATSMNSLFKGCRSLLRIPNIDTSNVSTLYSMFEDCHLITTIPEIVTNNVTNMNSMFKGCYSLQSIPNLVTDKVTNMSYMFEGCGSLRSIPVLNTSKVTDMSWMFDGCSSLRKIPALDTSNITSATYLFRGCSSLTELPDLNTSKIKNMNYMFGNCSSLEKAPNMDFSAATDISSMFRGCSSLLSVPAIDTSNVTKINELFYECYSLLETPPIDTTKCIGSYYNYNHFYSCPNLLKIGTVTLSKDIEIAIGNYLAKPPVAEISVAYNELDPPAFSKTVPIKLNYTQLSAEALNRLMEQLPDGNGKTLDLKYNPGSATCDPSIATAKNWTVLVK